MALHLFGLQHLPPRLRLSQEVLAAEVGARVWLGMKAWGDDLECRCREGNVPFVRAHPRLRLPTRPLSKLGIRWTPAMAAFAEAASPKRRRRRKNK
jgi:hypothetical protein